MALSEDPIFSLFLRYLFIEMLNVKCQNHPYGESLSHFLLFYHLKSDSHLPKKHVFFASMKALKNDEKCFLFYLKSSFSLARYLNFCFDFLVM